MKKIGSVVVVACWLLILALFSSSNFFVNEAAAQTKMLKIGLITSVTGPMAPAFKPMYDAVKPTEDLINQRGGITVDGQKYNIRLCPKVT